MFVVSGRVPWPHFAQRSEHILRTPVARGKSWLALRESWREATERANVGAHAARVMIIVILSVAKNPREIFHIRSR